MLISLITMMLCAGYVWLAWQIYSHYLVLRKGRVFSVLSFVFLYLITAMPIRMGDEVNILGVLLAAVAGTLVLSKGELLVRISIGLLFYAGTVSISAICDFVYMPVNQGWERVFIVLPRTFLWLFLWLFLRKKYPEGPIRLPARIWYLLDMLGCMPTAAILAVFMQLRQKEENAIQVYVLMLFSCLTFAGLLYLISLLCEHERMREEQKLWEMRKLHYENMEKEQQSLKRMRHDIANHLQVLSGLKEEEAAAYVKEWLDSPALQASKRFCENEVVNTVLAGKDKLCAASGIALTVRADLPGKIAMGKMDLCGLFANGLDNAIEACQRKKTGERAIWLRAACMKGLLLVEMKNTMADSPEADGEKLKTTKKEKSTHGFGTAEIQDICRKYGGAAEFSWEEGIFSLRCSLPVGSLTKKEKGR